jgi:YfiH family protein
VKVKDYQNPDILYGFIGKKQIDLEVYTYSSNNNQGKENQNKFLNLLPIKNAKLILMNQKHTNHVRFVDSFDDHDQSQELDSVITCKKHLVLAVQTADCIPIVIYSPEKKYIASIHAGWRGAYSGVVQNTLDNLMMLGANIENLDIIIGPHIRQESYEVDYDFYKNFIIQNNSNEKYFLSITNRGKFLFDLTLYVIDILKKYGIKNIYDCNINTYTDRNWPSYRRQMHFGEVKEHILTYIVIK